MAHRNGNGKTKRNGKKPAARKREKRHQSPRPPHKPTKLVAAIIDPLIKAIELGVSFRRACAIVRVDYSTHRKWMARAERALLDAEGTGKALLKEDLDHVAYFHRIKEAEAKFEQRMMKVIEDAAFGAPAVYDKKGKLITAEKKPQWTAAAWKLERRLQAEYALLQRHEHSGPGGGPIEHKTSQRIQELEAAFLARARAGSPPGRLPSDRN